MKYYESKGFLMIDKDGKILQCQGPVEIRIERSGFTSISLTFRDIMILAELPIEAIKEIKKGC